MIVNIHGGVRCSSLQWLVCIFLKNKCPFHFALLPSVLWIQLQPKRKWNGLRNLATQQGWECGWTAARVARSILFFTGQ